MYLLQQLVLLILARILIDNCKIIVCVCVCIQDERYRKLCKERQSSLGLGLGDEAKC